MPTSAQTFYFGTVDDDQDFPGVTEVVKKIQETAPTTNNATSITWTTTTVTEKTVIPLSGNQAAGDTSNSNGWAFNDAGTDGLGSVAGALRRIRAGIWSFGLRYFINTPALLDAHSAVIAAKVYRVADVNAGAGGTRTLLFTANSAEITAAAPSGTTITWNGASQPEILLQPGEVIMVGFTATSASTTATVLGANTNTVLTIGLDAQAFFTVPAPGIESIANTVGSSSGTSAVDGALAATGAMAGSSAGTASAAGTLSAIGASEGVASGAATADGSLAAVAPTVGSSDGLATATAALAAVGATVGTSTATATAEGAGATVLPTAGSSDGTSAASGSLSGVGAMAGTAAGAASVAGSMGAVAETSGDAQGQATVNGSLAAVAPTVGTVNVAEGGGSAEYPTGLLRLRGDGRIEAVPGSTGPLPSGALRITALP